MVYKSMQKFVALLRLSELTTPEDAPLNITGIESSPQTNIQETTSQIPEEKEILERSATLLLFPDTVKSSFWLAQEKCSSELQHNTMDLPTETCLSGDYELSSNLMISSVPRCANGYTPAMILYDQQNCRGNTLFQSTGPRDIPLETCLRYQTTKEWSLVFRCSIWPELVVGAERHEIAIPPRDPEDPRENGRSRGKAGLITRFEDDSCRSQTTKPEILAADKCIQTTGRGIQISKPALCPSGKRARIARFSDSNCDTPLEQKSIIKVYNSEINSCLGTEISEVNPERINSVAFHCRGFETKLEDPNQAQIYTDSSPPACGSSKELRYEIPKTVAVDTCVQLPYANIQINRRPTCPDGTRARFARFADTSCEISVNKNFLLEIKDEHVGTCLEEGFTRPVDDNKARAWNTPKEWNARSMAFWCEGLGNFKDRPISSTAATATCPTFDFRDYERGTVQNWEKGQLICNGADHKRLHPIADGTNCPEDAGTLAFNDYHQWGSEGPRLIHTLMNSCVHGVFHMRPVQVLNPGRCANGKRPMLALYYGLGCEEIYMRTMMELNEDVIGTWIEIWTVRSMALTCGGPVRDLNAGRKYSEADMENNRKYWEWHGKRGVLIALWVIVGVLGLVLIAGLVYWNVWGKVQVCVLNPEE